MGATRCVGGLLCLSQVHSNSIWAVKTAAKSEFGLVLRKLMQRGLLLESDPRLPSVCTLITGEPLHGSWWSHPQAQTIFRINEQLADHRDVLIIKLISGKVTFVHRKLWPEILAVGVAREEWQTNGLSRDALLLLGMIDEQSSLRTDEVTWPGGKHLKPGEAARELEKRLLIHSEEFHTTSGAHAKLLETWQQWAKRVDFTPQRILPDDAKKKLEGKIKALNKEFGALARLPWNTLRKTRTAKHDRS